MGDQIGKNRVFAQHCVNAIGLDAFEHIASANIGLDKGVKRGPLPFDLFPGHDAGENHIAVGLIFFPALRETSAAQIGLQSGFISRSYFLLDHQAIMAENSGSGN
jgi:hypothetical protein